MNHCAFHRPFPSPRAARHLPWPASQSIESAPEERFARDPTMALSVHQDTDSFRKTGL
jgi:hypothetical protein